MAVIGVLCVVGSFSIAQRMFDVYVMLFFGVVGFILREMKYPMAPLVLGIVLGELLDLNLGRRAIVDAGRPNSILCPTDQHGALDHHTGEHPVEHSSGEPACPKSLWFPQSARRTPAEPADPQKRSRNASRTKAEVLSAARDEFCEEGFNGARVDLIAARAKANKRLLYHYFGNRSALRSRPARRLS